MTGEPLHTTHDCASCPQATMAHLQKLGVETRGFDFVVALAGNPNTGKSTVFNALTGLKQHTGNWPGKTVTRAEGAFVFKDKKFKIIDLPGTYSLLSTSKDEEVARNFLLFGRPDVTVIVADATRLERNLNLALQILEITDRAVLCVNLMDEARRHGIRVDLRALARRLGVPVVGTSARYLQGIPELLEAIYDVATGKVRCKPHRIQSLPPHIEKAVRTLSQKIEQQFPGLPNSRWIAFRLLEGETGIIEALKNQMSG